MRIIRRLKKDVEAEFHQYRRIAQLVESLSLIAPPSDGKKKKKAADAEAAGDGSKFKVDDAVECDVEGNNEFLPCTVARINDDGTYDLEFVGIYHAFNM